MCECYCNLKVVKSLVIKDQDTLNSDFVENTVFQVGR